VKKGEEEQMKKEAKKGRIEAPQFTFLATPLTVTQKYTYGPPTLSFHYV